MKQYSAITSGTLLLLCALAANGAVEAPADPAAAARARVLAWFMGAEEPMAEAALWTSDRIFSVGVHDMGGVENGYARHVCEILGREGLHTGYRVRVVDINTMGSREEDWEIIGTANCLQATPE